LARRPLLVEHVGAAAAAVVLPLRRSGRRVGAGQPGVARDSTTAGGRIVSFLDDGRRAVEWAAAYRDRVGDLPVLAQVAPGDVSSALPSAAPEQGRSFEELLAEVDRVIVPGVTHWQSPRFFAYFATTGSDPGILAELLTAALNNVGILWRASPALQELETTVLAWLAQLIGLPQGWHGHLEEGASFSTLASLAAAREARPGARVVVCSEHAH